ncbi:DUF1173 domain-containing protein [Methylibium petroleiphilum]|uniref:DUF1173 domain-containing protein n=1 Tax=Methylibium petroleiphilum TaxID=105560 RepID=UPI001AC7632B|nr:DUF1173 domain-containing protein [Methylibium petroleiphilum]MBN9202997.1 DUF1173 domain-containing protein [Methylibium petroleiphilum]
MDTSDQGITSPSAVYEISGRRFEIGARGFAEAIADAHAAHQRPRCLCLAEGVEMYVARLGEGYIVKRMPDTGSRHAPDCPSYEPPAEVSGLGQLLGSAITEDPATGETTLKLDFPLTKMPGRSQMPPAGGESGSVASDGSRLSLRGLLHYLWDQAELTRWHPGFAGKRTWATVRRHLLQAAEQKFARGQSLQSRLYIPEFFSVEQRDAISARRLSHWVRAIQTPGKVQQLMLMICEVKEIVPARYGFKAVVKHLPDQAFAIDERLYWRLTRHFEPELALWGASDATRMVMISTFRLNTVGAPAIVEMSLLPVTAHWLPVENAFDQQLIDTMVGESRSFVRCLRYGLSQSQVVATAVLFDTGSRACPLYVSTPGDDGQIAAFVEARCPDAWLWQTCGSDMPPLPGRASRSAAATAPVAA